MYKVLQQVAFGLLTLILTGCTSMVVGDALLTIRGRLVMSGASAEECNLALSLVNERTAAPYNSRRIGVEFSVDFTVDPSAAKDYRVTITCPGYEAIEKTIRSAPPETHVDLGTLTLARKQ